MHLTSGDTLAGIVTTRDGQFRVATANTGTMSATKDKVKAITSKEEEAAYEKEHLVRCLADGGPAVANTPLSRIAQGADEGGGVGHWVNLIGG